MVWGGSFNVSSNGLFQALAPRDFFTQCPRIVRARMKQTDVVGQVLGQTKRTLRLESIQEGAGSIKQSESFFLESNYHPSFDTIRHLLTSLYDGDIVIGIVKTKPCSRLNAIRLKKQTKFTD